MRPIIALIPRVYKRYSWWVNTNW